jgi:hypothetical protein
MHNLLYRANRTLSLLMVALFVSGMALAGVPSRQTLAAPVNCGVSGEAYVANVAALGLLQTKLGGVTLGGASGAQVNLNLLNALTSLNATAVSAMSTDTSVGTTAEATSVATIVGLNLDSNINLPLVPALGTLLNVDLLNITAGAITVTSKSSSTVGGPTTYTGTTNVVNLQVGGQTLNGDVPANTVIIPVFLNVPLLNINLVQIAKVTVNEQKFVNGSLVVNGLHVEILSSTLPALSSLQVGDIILGSATAKATCTGSVPSGLTISGVSPTQGPTTGGTTATITGSGFQTGATVTFGGVAATNVTVVAGNGIITAVTPAHAAGPVDVVVTNPSGTPISATLTGGFTYLAAPTVVTVSACIANGVAILTVNGTGFLPSTLLSINGTGLQNTAIVVNNANQLTATVASSLLNLSGINTFVAINPGNILSVQLSLGTLAACPNPTITSINPTQGPTTGGTVVAIGGTNFQTGTAVTFDGAPATNVTVNSATSITATTPAHAAGAVDVVVTSPVTGTQPATITNGFTFVASPSASPSTSPSASPSTSPSTSPSASPSTSPSTNPAPSPSTPGGNEGTPPTLTDLFLVGTGQVPPMTNGRVTFLATIQDNAALGGVEASMNANGPWQRVVDISGNGAGPFRIAGGFDTTNAAFGGSTTAGNKTVYLRAFDAQSNVSPTQTLLVNYPSQLKTFSDVSGDPETVNAIYQLAARGIIKGYEDGTFGPSDPTVRAQMAALISRSIGWGNEDHGNTFPDRGPVDDELWRQVGNLDFYGVARGYSDSATCASANTTAPCYLPLDEVTQVQTISFITRAMVRIGYWTPQGDNQSLYPNVPASSGHRVDLATYVHYLGAVPGTSATSDWTSYDQPASRAFFALAEWQAVKWREDSANWGIIPRP